MNDLAMFVTQSNIIRLRKLLKDTLPDQVRKTVEDILANAEVALAHERALSESVAHRYQHTPRLDLPERLPQLCPGPPP
jgi:hypothetical protein